LIKKLKSLENDLFKIYDSKKSDSLADNVLLAPDIFYAASIMKEE
jgi:hypothetical protein